MLDVVSRLYQIKLVLTDHKNKIIVPDWCLTVERQSLFLDLYTHVPQFCLVKTNWLFTELCGKFSCTLLESVSYPDLDLGCPILTQILDRSFRFKPEFTNGQHIELTFFSEFFSLRNLPPHDHLHCYC